jgi:hypothetical protein
MRFSEKFHNNLATYAAAAGAAGVTMIAMAQPARADIVYTPTNQRLVNNLSIDLHGIRVITLNATVSYGANTTLHRVFVSAGAPVGAGVVVAVAGQNTADALAQGTPIGSGDNFSLVGFMASRWKINYPGTYGSGGMWVNVTNHYLGFEFKTNGQVHYGWARLTVLNGPGITINTRLTGYAYNTVPGQQILAGQTGPADLAAKTAPHILAAETAPQIVAAETGGAAPGTLGLLALGSLGLGYWRPKKQARP